MQEKTCTKCKKIFPATLDFFYKNAGGKYGITPRCKPCVNEDNVASHVARRGREPEKVKAQGNARARKHYHNNSDKCRKTCRDSAAKAYLDPVKRMIKRTRQRGGYCGLTPEELNVIREAQGNTCAICGDSDPTDLDHCHVTGQVRWLLCKHCNRGLGAFKDSPDLLCKAANLLRGMQVSQGLL